MTTDKDLLDHLLMARKLARERCPLCGYIIFNPLASQEAFSHRYDPGQFHRCAARPK